MPAVSTGVCCQVSQDAKSLDGRSSEGTDPKSMVILQIVNGTRRCYACPTNAVLAPRRALAPLHRAGNPSEATNVSLLLETVNGAMEQYCEASEVHADLSGGSLTRHLTCKLLI